jgi:nitronate monooxygenase
MKSLPTIRIKDARKEVIFAQGGMGIGISLATLAKAVAQRGGIGTISSAGLAAIVVKPGRRAILVAAIIEVADSKTAGLLPSISWWLYTGFTDSILGAVEGGVDALILDRPSTNLPDSLEKSDVALIPIVSSAKALRIIYKRWTDRLKRAPDAVILEGPLAGGHLGFSFQS